MGNCRCCRKKTEELDEGFIGREEPIDPTPLLTHADHIYACPGELNCVCREYEEYEDNNENEKVFHVEYINGRYAVFGKFL